MKISTMSCQSAIISVQSNRETTQKNQRYLFDFLHFENIILNHGGNLPISHQITEESIALTKADLVQQVYNNHDSLTKAQAIESVEAFLRLSKKTLISGSDLLLSGFGKFKVRDKQSRMGRNPQTGDYLMLNARRVVTFHLAGGLRKIVNSK